MRLENPFQQIALRELFESLLPDFVLAFAFFTSVVYAILSQRFERQRPAIAMSAAIGFALSIGLVWWERANDYSIKDLGPIAVGFAILVLALVMYQSIRHVGGSWAGAGITIGAAIIIATLLELNLLIDTEILQTLTIVALIMGILAFVHNTRGHAMHFPYLSRDLPDVRHDMSDLYRNRHLSNQLTKRMRKLRHKANILNEHPEEGADVLLQLKRMLPAEGYLTQRMAILRAKAHRIRSGHIARLEETRYVYAKLPKSAKKKASAELTARYNQLIDIDTRLERLDKAVAENERRIKELTNEAQKYTTKYDYQKLCDCLKAAQKLQRHNSKLFKTIDRTENKLTAIAKDVARQVKRVNKQ